MSDETGYNGWHNYETWCVNLWFDNENSSYNDVRQLAVDILEVCRDEERDADDGPYLLADLLQEYAGDLAEMVAPSIFETASFVTDFYNAAMNEVDWSEIAENLLDEVRTQASV